MKIIQIKLLWLSALKLRARKNQKVRFTMLTFIVLLVSVSQMLAGIPDDISSVGSQPEEKEISGNIADLNGDPIIGATCLTSAKCGQLT